MVVYAVGILPSIGAIERFISGKGTLITTKTLILYLLMAILW